MGFIFQYCFRLHTASRFEVYKFNRALKPFAGPWHGRTSDTPSFYVSRYGIYGQGMGTFGGERRAPEVDPAIGE